MKKKTNARSQKSVAYKTPAPVLPTTLDEYIQSILAQRTGGVVNLRGIRYQLLYACQTLLGSITPENGVTVQLEGLEDVDIHHAVMVGEAEYVQLKTSTNTLNAGSFWDLGVLQNFYAVHRAAPQAIFRLVHDMFLATGHLQHLTSKNWSAEALSHWTNKLKTIDNSLTHEAVSAFLHQLRFEHATEEELRERCIRFLLANHDIHAASEEQYLKALFYHAFEWSRTRATIGYQQIAEVIQAIKDSYSKAPINKAVRHNWIERVVYSAQGESDATEGYFDGQSAKPRHIALGLPVRRRHWEDRIEAELKTAHVVLIKASSGQGKSTLAWQVGLNLQLRGYSVYQLRACNRLDTVAALMDYLHAWTRVGELPLVIIDGLNSQVELWAELAGRAAELPVKFLVTSREEDWYRYGTDPTVVSVKSVETMLSDSEAQSIYAELLVRGKIHQEVSRWQPAWESVATKGLLIEYVYLLTQGQMLEDRLATQIKLLNREQQDAAAKLEILRLVAVTDCLNLQLDTSRLVGHVRTTVRFDSDAGEVLKQLEREYFLRFGAKRVEGLHPIRSRHLVKLLHDLLPIEESLLKVFHLITADETYDFFLAAPAMLAEVNKKEFYRQLAIDLAHRSFPEMAAALDGLLCGAAFRYWQDNRTVFDAVSAKGGLELFIPQTLPFTRLNTLEELSNISDSSLGSLDQLLEQKQALTPLSLAESDLLFLTTVLHTQLCKREDGSTAYAGVGALSHWLHRLDLPFPRLVNWNEDFVLRELHSKPIEELMELFRFLWLADAARCANLIQRHKEQIVARLKVLTDTPTFEERDDECHLEYLLDADQADRANALSVSRLDTIHAFFPNYQLYHIKGVMFEFLPEHITNAVVQNSVKRMTSATLPPPAEVRINQLWIDTILNIYRASSIYEWQEKLYRLRLAALEFAKRCVQFLEIRLEQNIKRDEAAVKSLVEQSELVEELRLNRLKFPAARDDKPSVKKIKIEEKHVDDWLYSLRNFNGQFGGIISPKTDNSRNLAIINLRATVQKLPMMQAAHRTIGSQHPYFELAILEADETMWFRRLLNSAQFYIHCQEAAPTMRVYNAKDRAKHWAEVTSRAELENFYAVFQSFSTFPGVIFHLPTYLEREETLVKAVVGVEGVDFKDEHTVTMMLAGIADIGQLDIDFLTILPVENGLASSGPRYSKALFQHLATIIAGEEAGELYEWMLPNFVNITLDVLAPLPGLEMRMVQNQQMHTGLFQAMEKLWKLGEYRQRLNKVGSIEQQWLHALEKDIVPFVHNEVASLRPLLNPKTFSHLSDCVADFTNHTLPLQHTELVQLVKEVSAEIPA